MCDRQRATSLPPQPGGLLVILLATVQSSLAAWMHVCVREQWVDDWLMSILIWIKDQVSCQEPHCSDFSADVTNTFLAVACDQ